MNTQEQTTINQRLSILIDEFERGSKAIFASKIGVSAQSIHDLIGGRRGMPSFKVVSSILEQYPVIDANWLVTGQGQMLREAVPPATITLESQSHPLTPEQWEALKKTLIDITPAQAAASVETERMGRTYHLGKQATPGLGYDDRLTMRIAPFDEKDLLEIMNKPESDGGLRHRKIGDKYIVTEQAIRQWFGDRR